MIFGPRLRLRPLERADIPAMLVWLADPEVRATLSIYRPLNGVEEAQWFESNAAAGDKQAWGIEIPNGNGGWWLIGNCGFHSLNWRVRKAELGIVIGDKSQWDKGYGTEAVRVLVDWAFGTLNLNRVELAVYARNARAQRAYTKAGLVVEGTLRQASYYNGRYDDVIQMAVLRQDWTPLTA